MPAQGKPKEDFKSSNGPRLNEAITAKFIRLVSDDGEQIGERAVLRVKFRSAIESRV